MKILGRRGPTRRDTSRGCPLETCLLPTRVIFSNVKPYQRRYGMPKNLAERCPPWMGRV